MGYIKAEGEYPRPMGDVQLFKKGWSEGDTSPAGWQVVAETEKPVAGIDQLIHHSGPADVAGLSEVQANRLSVIALM